ncbi:hypothetical protein V8C37DRAFT_387015 [Trichoderma ceciliae]
MAQELHSAKAKKRFNHQDIAVIKESDEKQKEFHAFVSNHSQFSTEEKYALQIESVAAFEEHWNLTADSKRKFDEIHEHGLGLAGQRAQKFASSAYNVLQQMTPIVQLVQNFGAPYGSMAIGTISILLTVAKNRARMETGISDTLSQISDRAAGLKVYQHIYNDDDELDQQLQSKIVQAYENFMSFCMEATKYYSKGGIRRWFKAVMGSSQTLDDRASQAQKSIVDVRFMSEELLSKNVDKIKQLNISQIQDIKDLQEQIEQLQTGLDSNRLDKIKALLNLETYSRETELEVLQKYERDTVAHLDKSWSLLELMRGPRLEAFKKDPKIQSWECSQRSCMLILAGYNWGADASIGTCWLSPVALDIITTMEETRPGDPYAFYILGHREYDPFPHVLSCILFQLLTLSPKALQNYAQYAELCAEIQEYQAAREATEAKELDKDLQECAGNPDAILHKVALRILKMLDQNKTVWIILDRVDQCKSDSRINHRKRLMKSIVYLLEKATVKIRVLAVVNGYDWRVEEQSDEFGASNHASVIVHTCRQEVVG